MPNTIMTYKNGLKAAHVSFGLHGASPGSLKQIVHDGDTVAVRSLNNFGVRFLGVDAAEISYTLPGKTTFTSTSDPKWKDFLRDPFAGPEGAAYKSILNIGLLNHIESIRTENAGEVHALYAKQAEKELENEVDKDLKEMGKSKDNFEFFIAFAYEVMDGYGRLLGYINRNQESGERPKTYNERLLQKGLVSPYFIWPNVNPFRRQKSPADAVPEAGAASDIANKEKTLREAREMVKTSRNNKTGIYSVIQPLKILSFELRFMARRELPKRWLIDLSRNDDRLVPPEEYYTVPNEEDRLWIPLEFIPLFNDKGWKLG
jgi:hypothetical protein